MMNNFIPLLILIITIVALLVFIKVCIGRGMKGPAEKEGIHKGVLAALLTDSWIFGWLYAKKKSDYDYQNRKLK